MTAKPTVKPRWATNPPPSSITAPTSQQLDEGWQPEGSTTYPAGKPVRQHMNWWQNLVGSWVEWLSQGGYLGDWLADQGIPGTGSLPTTGAGLAISGGDFSSSAIVGGYRIGADDAPSPVYTYTASKDTYWDLKNDATWTAVPVNNGAGVPAVTANSVRIFKVVTDATARTTVTDLRPSVLSVTKGLKLGSGMTTNAAAPLSFARQDATVRYTLVSEDATDALTTREYWTGDALGVATAVARVRTYNARWNQGSLQWERDAGQNSWMEMLGANGVAVYFHSEGDASPWSDGAWLLVSNYRAGTTSDVYLRQLLSGGLYQYGFDAPRTLIKIIGVERAAFQNTAGDQVLLVPDGVGTGRLQWSAVAPAGDRDLTFVIDIPHAAIISSVEVLFSNGGAAATSISLYRQDMSDLAGAIVVASLRSAGMSVNPGSIASAAWYSIPSIDQNQTVDNINYRYFCTVKGLAGETTTVQAIRVTATAPYLTNQ